MGRPCRRVFRVLYGFGLRRIGPSHRYLRGGLERCRDLRCGSLRRNSVDPTLVEPEIRYMRLQISSLRAW